MNREVVQKGSVKRETLEEIYDIILKKPFSLVDVSHGTLSYLLRLALTSGSSERAPGRLDVPRRHAPLRLAVQAGRESVVRRAAVVEEAMVRRGITWEERRKQMR